MQIDGTTLALGAVGLLALAVGRPRGSRKILRMDNGAELEVNKLGAGMFAKVWITKHGKRQVYVQSPLPPEGDYAKEILAMINDDTRSPYLPRVKEVGTRGDITIYKMPLYRAPLRKTDSPKAWAQYKALAHCLDIGWKKMSRYSRSHKVRSVHLGYMMMDHTIDCARADRSLPRGLIRALELLRDYAANFGADWTFEFSPRNLATTESGHLILLDVVFSQELLDKRRGHR